MDTEHIIEYVPFVARKAKLNPRKWAVNKRGSHVGELEQKLKLTTIVLHDDRIVDEIHLTKSSEFVAAKKEVG